MPDGKAVQFKKLFWSALAGLAAVTLAACGGGGGGSTAGVVSGGGGGGGPVVIPPPACVLGSAPAITISLNASRVSGVAPLAVFFDASATLSTTFPTRPFHDLGFRWNFGESVGPGIATWGIGARPAGSRNEAVGPMAAHVFETPGTYTVCVTVTDGTTTVDGAVVITVDDPNVVFAGANTICVGATVLPTAGVNGCPVSATVQQTADFSTAMGFATTGRRVLFQRGDTWTAPGGALVPRLSANGPGIIGAFGLAGAPPLIQPVALPGNTILAISGPSSPNISDWRIMDLDLNGLGGVDSNGIIGAGGAHQITILRVRANDTSNGFQFARTILDVLNGAGPPGGHLIYSQLAIVDSRVERTAGGGGNGMFLEARQLSILGNFVDDTIGAEHNIRIQYVVGGVMQSNDLGLPATTKTVLTLRAVNVGAGGVTSPNNSEKVVITDSLFRSGLAAQPISIQPSAATEDQRISDIIMDGNFIRSGPSAQQAIVTAADEVTLRNNVIDMTGATAFNCMLSQRLGIEPAHSQIRYFNNTCFTNTAGGGALRMVFLDATNTDITVANNLAFAPNLTGPSVLLFNLGSASVTGAGGSLGNSADAQINTTPPNFASAGGATVAGYALNVPSYAIDGGVAVPVFTDILRNNRPTGAFDIGATEQ